jgi:hypothetical protein
LPLRRFAHLLDVRVRETEPRNATATFDANNVLKMEPAAMYS